MAVSKALFIALIVATVASPALAREWMVGGDAGWKLGFDYSEWAKGIDFHVGDTLMFMYDNSSHNVMKLNQSDFQNCVKTKNKTDIFTSGNDVFTLKTPGKKWYICGVSEHCSKGMKLVIDVSASEAPAPAPSSPATPSPPPSAASHVAASGVALVGVALAVLKMMMA